MRQLSASGLRRLDSIAGLLAILALTVSFGVAVLVWHNTRELETKRTEAICREVRDLRADIVGFLEGRPGIDADDVEEFRAVRCAARPSEPTLFLEGR